MRGKKGFLVIWIVLVAITLIALGLGYLFFNKIVAALGSIWFIGAAIFILAVIFKAPLIKIFDGVWKIVMKFPWIILIAIVAAIIKFFVLN
jgi:hypothetical protein